MLARTCAWIGLLAASLAVPGVARAAGGVECMAKSYDAGELSQIAALSKRLSFDAQGSSAGEALAQITTKVAYECSDQHGWPESVFYYAVIYELGRLSEAAYRRSGRLTDEQIRRLDSALATGDRSHVWAVMEDAVMAGLENREPVTTPQEDMLMAGFLLSAGFGDDEAVGERVGELLGTMALQRVGRREFNALMEGE
jgi:hypothetical protein